MDSRKSLKVIGEFSVKKVIGKKKDGIEELCEKYSTP